MSRRPRLLTRVTAVLSSSQRIFQFITDSSHEERDPPSECDQHEDGLTDHQFLHDWDLDAWLTGTLMP